MGKCHYLAGTLVALCIASSAVAATVHEEVSFEPRCKQVAVGKPVLFHGRRLEETPDITAPDLRLASTLLSHRCREAATQLLDRYLQKHPQDFRVAFLQARLAWTAGDTVKTSEILATTLREHPDFASAQVLQASLFIEQQNLDEAAQLLDSLSLHSPTDLWVFLDGLLIEARRSPSQALQETFFEIVKNPSFPPSARETASRVGRRTPNLSREKYEAFYWADLEYESATPMSCKIHDLAFMLSEHGGRFAQARVVLESPKAQGDNCGTVASNRVLLAQAYLMEAAHISAGPSAANAALVSKAHDTLGGDWSALAEYVIGRPQFATLQPFIASGMSPGDTDQYGYTQLCNALMASDVTAVQAQLDLGADPNGRCDQYSLLGYLIMSGMNERIAASRQTIVSLLLNAGAKPTEQEIAQCRNPENGLHCARLYLPLLERK